MNIKANIFQLEKQKNEQSKYFEKTFKEHSIYLKKDIEIKNFIYKLFKNYEMIVSNSKLYYLKNSLHIFVSYHQNCEYSLSKVFGANQTQKNFQVKKIKSFIKKYKKNWNKLKNQVQKSIIVLKIFMDNFGILKLKQKNKNFQLQNWIRWNWNKWKSIKQLVIKNKKELKINTTKFSKKIFLKKNIINIVQLFFNSLVNFNNKKIKILLILQRLKNNLKQIMNKKIKKSLKKNLANLRKYVPQKFFKESMNLLFTFASSRKSAALLSELIVVQLKKLKRHNFFLKFIQNALKSIKSNVFSNFIGIEIQVKGRLNGRPRARSKTIKIMNSKRALISTSTLDYSEKMAFTANGTLGVKVWLHQLV